MFGEFMKTTSTGVFILTNASPYWSSIKFLARSSITEQPEDLTMGCKVYFDGQKITLSDFENCQRCHKCILEGEVTKFHGSSIILHLCNTYSNEIFTFMQYLFK